MDTSRLHKTSNGHLYHLWACPRPLTRHWGSGQVWKRICESLGMPDVAFGKTDGIPSDVLAIDRNNGYEWRDLPFDDNQFAFGYWDPPYEDENGNHCLFRPECLEIWRTCRKLAILHTHVYPTSWMDGAKRVASIAVTFGPFKQVRLLQVFEKGS